MATDIADGQLDEWTTAFAAPTDEPELMYPDVESWVGQHLSPMVRRQLGGGLTWCSAWWRHAEAVSRLEAMWRAWESLRLEPALGMSVWWRDHADPQLAVLMSRDLGPFAACTPNKHSEELPDLPCDAAPAAFWGVTELPDGDGDGAANAADEAQEDEVRSTHEDLC